MLSIARRSLSALAAALIAVPLFSLVRCRGRSATTEHAAPADVPGRSDLADHPEQLGAWRSVVDCRRFARSHLGAAPAALDSRRAARKAAPPVLEFDTAGKLLGSWGGPGDGYDWPEREHGIYVDAKDSSGSAATAAGPSHARRQQRRHDPEVHAGRKAGAADRAARQEHRQHATRPTCISPPTCSCTRRRTSCTWPMATAISASWCSMPRAESSSACGARSATRPRRRRRTPRAAPRAAPGRRRGPPQFGLVHAVKVSRDGIVYVADRTNNRVQTFTTAGKFFDR